MTAPWIEDDSAPGMVWVPCEACGQLLQSAKHWVDGSRDYMDPPYTLCSPCLRILWGLDKG